MFISSLHIYPLKSARGIALDEVDLQSAGLAGDRQLMLVAPDGQFVTQRELPELAQLQVQPNGDGFRLWLDNSGSVRVTAGDFSERKPVAVWRSLVDAAVATDTANTALSDWFGRPLQLVLFDARARRMSSPDWAGPDAPVRFADGYPVLITTTASLEALNADMQAHGEGIVPMDRFRPNVVIDGALPWQEDSWAAIRIGGLRFDLVKPCSRCIMTSQDQESGARSGPSPLAAMGRLRMSGDRRVPGPLFGWNAVPREEGRLRLGDAVEILEERPEGIALKARRDR